MIPQFTYTITQPAYKTTVSLFNFDLNQQQSRVTRPLKYLKIFDKYLSITRRAKLWPSSDLSFAANIGLNEISIQNHVRIHDLIYQIFIKLQTLLLITIHL
jgi:hypothetical protein